MEGAAKVNGELEVGFDPRFEGTWVKAERVGHVVMVLFIAAGAVGLFGRGPHSHRTNKTPESDLAVDFEPIARSQTGTQVTLHLNNPTESPTIDVFIGSNSVEPMGLQHILPEPVETRVVDKGMTMIVPVPPGTSNAALRLILMPTSLGPNQLVAQVAGHAPLRWTQYVVP